MTRCALTASNTHRPTAGSPTPHALLMPANPQPTAEHHILIVLGGAEAVGRLAWQRNSHVGTARTPLDTS